MALEILSEHRAKLDALAVRLVEQETLDREDVVAFFADIEKRQPRPHEVRGAALAVSRQAMEPPEPVPGPPGTLDGR